MAKTKPARKKTRQAGQMIQVDMFEVQVGAALLLQFKTKEGTVVRVLADAGVGQGLPVTHVHDKLPSAFKSFGGSDHRIDLIIGTHYDADHLDGLIPIIQDQRIEITEAWLPPVANDSELHSFDTPIGDHNLLAKQLYDDDNHEVLLHYLKAKREICERLRPQREDANDDNRPADEWTNHDIPRALDFFKKRRDEAIGSLSPRSESFTHADDEQFNPAELNELLGLVGTGEFWSRPWHYRDWLHHDPNAVLADITRSVAAKSTAAQNLAWIRKAAAGDAINAISLAKVVDALRARGVPILCQTIPDGIPRRYVWRTGSRRFEGGTHLPPQGPVIVLFGPSEGLVRKHWNRLPIGTYGTIATFALIPIKNITPSNQLSYVARFEAEKQGILVAGDAGCVDFKPKRNSPHYYPKLLDALLPLHVVQVAHHAGNNAHFYRVLAAANYPHQVSQSFLLVSHATKDPHRPSREFNQFVQDLRRQPEVIKLLFTTQPRADKIHEFKPLVHPNVGTTAASAGDARLVFRQGAWEVLMHAIKV
jgi:hypothetical protein